MGETGGVATYLALLRGINVGGKRSVKMADLSRWCHDTGCQDVRTYIQSGNVVCRHTTRSGDALAARLAEVLGERAGFAIPVTVRSAAQWAQVVRDNPFSERDPAHLHVSFLDGPPPPGAFDGIDRAAFGSEDFAVIGREVYLHLPAGMARTKLPQALGLYRRMAATTRNWRTVLTLQDLASPPPG
jgi:uncharacterized protein (DUF1697 family)